MSSAFELFQFSLDSIALGASVIQFHQFGLLQFSVSLIRQLQLAIVTNGFGGALGSDAFYLSGEFDIARLAGGINGAEFPAKLGASH